MPRFHKTTKSTAPNNKAKVQEIIKCSDPLYFIKTYCKIAHPLKGLISFETFPYQDDCIKAMTENRFVIVNKSRQLGLSTVSSGYSLWLALFHKEKNIVIVANKLAVAQNFMKKVFTALDNLPSWLIMPKITRRTLTDLCFSNGSQIKAIATTSSAGRSEAISLILIDEAAHIDGVDDLWLGVSPTLACVSADTLILTDRGFQKIKDYFSGNHKPGDYFDLKVPIYGKNGMETTSHGYVSPNHETLVVTTKHGHEVEVTPIHPLYVQQKDGIGKMIQAQELKTGDCLRIECSMDKFGTYSLPEDISYMLGGYIAEGWTKKGRKLKDGTRKIDGICIENHDNDFKNVFIKTKNLKKPFKPQPSRNSRLYCFSQEIVQYFIELGIDPYARCYNKETPWSILQGDKTTVANYLSGLFDGDGSCGERHICLSSTSHTLLKQTQQLLLNFGIRSNVYEQNVQKARERDVGKRVMPGGKVLRSLRRNWILSIPHSHYGLFAKEIGFKIKRKQNNCLKIIKKRSQNDFKLWTIPVRNIENKVKELIKKSGKTYAWFREEHKLRLDKCFDKKKETRFVNQNWLNRFKTVIEQEINLTPEDNKFFNENLGSFFWDPIVSIRKSENVTYDFTVPGTHSFLQNCILGSNTGGSAILISSPSGVGTLFHKIWVGAQSGENGFVPIELPWTVHPERDEAWFKREAAVTRAAKGERGVAMEYLCSFIGSGDTFVNSDVLEAMEKNICNPIATHPTNPDVWIWKYAEPGHRYAISADVSRGDAADFSAFHVIDFDNSEVVCEYKGKIPPDNFAQLLIEVGTKYNNAVLCPENNGPGLVTALELKKSDYANLFFQKSSKNAYDVYLKKGNNGNSDELPGISTQTKNREEMLTRLENSLRNMSIKIYSKRFLEELKTFVWKNNKAQAMKGYNDDLVMSLGISMSLFDLEQVESVDMVELSKTLLSCISSNVRTVESIGGDDAGKNEGWGITYQEIDSSLPSFLDINKPNNQSTTNPAEKASNDARTQYYRNLAREYYAKWGWVL